MELDRIHPELQHVYRRAPKLPMHSKLFLSFANFILRLRRERKAIDGVTIRNVRADGASVRVYSPPQPGCGAAMLWIHGGGLLVGRASINDDLCAQYARDLGLVVVSANYRLAYKQPYPAAIDDCFNAWRWLQANAGELGIDAARVAISGQSAGGGLAASLVQRVIDGGGVQPAAQALFCPMLDDRTAAREELDTIEHRMWNNRNNRTGWSTYLGQDAGMPATPKYAVPARREDLSGMPPSWIGIGDVDLFYEESAVYARRLAEAGNDCELHTAPMAPHAFELLAPESTLAREFFESNYRFLRNTLALPG
ncbi:alpha/beta hydrolase [Mangrovimicrobium sediminis]|uniref:Alpha/beta hydrolase n=2 Tax=Mangrovimicrobium sediminis TaxID=2562682 RepID=A0A4Z0MA55_9GAMM|nr:alpha/beta hydrolase [Haliea sp. SAOS-164]